MNQTVFVVDDDAAMRDALAQLLETAGLQVEAHADGPAFLAAFESNRRGCLLLDMAMPGINGLEVQAALNARGLTIPTIFLTTTAVFEEIADRLEIQDANPFRIRAYRNAARTLGELPQEARALLEKGEDLTRLPGIGDDRAAKIREIVTTGRCGLLDRLRRELPPAVTELLQIPGLDRSGSRRCTTTLRCRPSSSCTGRRATVRAAPLRKNLPAVPDARPARPGGKHRRGPGAGQENRGNVRRPRLDRV